jgi:monoamine oxidase
LLNSGIPVAARQGAGTVTLTFRQGKRTTTQTADKVVLALPFSILRSSVDFSGAGFKPLKQTAIRELGMGTNAKLHVQFTDRHWQGLGCDGETFADRGYQNTWEESRAQAGRSGILVNYTGGSVGASFGSGSPASRARQFLAQLEPVLPGITAKWNGRATVRPVVVEFGVMGRRQCSHGIAARLEASWTDRFAISANSWSSWERCLGPSSASPWP